MAEKAPYNPLHARSYDVKRLEGRPAIIRCTLTEPAGQPGGSFAISLDVSRRESPPPETCVGVMRKKGSLTCLPSLFSLAPRGQALVAWR